MNTSEIILNCLVESGVKVSEKALNHFYRIIIDKFGTELGSTSGLNGYLERLIGDEKTIRALPTIASLRGRLSDNFGEIKTSFNSFEDVTYLLPFNLRNKYSSDDLQNLVSGILATQKVKSEGRGGPYSFCYSHNDLPEIWVGLAKS